MCRAIEAKVLLRGETDTDGISVWHKQSFIVQIRPHLLLELIFIFAGFNLRR